MERVEARILSVVLLLSTAGGMLAGEPAVRAAGTNEVLKVELELSDGSRLIGTPGIVTVPVQTAFAKMDVPLTQIQTLKIGDDHETVSAVERLWLHPAQMVAHRGGQFARVQGFANHHMPSLL
jgi:hypothetical protein